MPGISHRTGRALTDRQRAFVEFIRRYVQSNGFSPSYREIAEGMQVSLRYIHQVVTVLEHKGALDRRPGQPRTLRVV
ncbi:MAG: hypothetical protein FJY97_08155 [candidate division Zixibacteria bacterium]|nr:hypothetical protein [candidate division Zixibacteria bacterium]